MSSLLSPEVSLPFSDVKTVEAKKSVKIMEEVEDRTGATTTSTPGTAVVEAEKFSTPEGMDPSTTAVTTAVKTPCFISYVDSVTNTPATSSDGGSPPTVPATVDTPGTTSISEKTIFRNVATPATAKKVKKVRAKGVTLFDETSPNFSLDLDAEISIAKAHPMTTTVSKKSIGSGKISSIFGLLALTLFTAAFVVNRRNHGSSTSSKSVAAAPKRFSPIRNNITRLKEEVADKVVAGKVSFCEMKEDTGVRVSVVLNHFKTAFLNALTMEFDELSFALLEM